MKKAIIVGASGQDGRILTEYLLKNNYIVLGISQNQTHCSDKTDWEPIDILNYDSVASVITKFSPDEIYYLAAFHHSSEQLDNNDPLNLLRNSLNINVYGLIYFLEAIRCIYPSARLFYASSCLIFGETYSAPQNEETPFKPSDIYGISKVTGIHFCHYYRNYYGIFSAVGILYNHESALRPAHFASQKIIQDALSIKRGEKQSLSLGDLSAEIDWGYAADFIEAMHAILQIDSPDDFIIATGSAHTIKEFVAITFSKLGLDWKRYIKEEQHIIHRKRGKLVGNYAKLHTMTGWSPKTSLEQIIEHMLNGDYLS